VELTNGSTHVAQVYGSNFIRTCLLAAPSHARFLLHLFFDPKGEGDMFLRNVGWLSTKHGVKSQKIKIFITTPVKALNFTENSKIKN
jgi:hypothetical protein